MLLALLATLVCCSCGKKRATVPPESLLAQIGPKTISLAEFIRRAEYTIRPPYCKGDNYIHKKIILNSLIAEKLLALEAGENNELTRNEQFQDYIRGRQEQAMRQWLYYQTAYSTVNLDTSEIIKSYDLAGRKYSINFISLDDSSKINQFSRELKQGTASFENFYRQHFGLEAIPQRAVSWEEQTEEAIHQALFSAPLQKGQIIGPIKTEDGHYLLMEIAGWTDRLAISDTDIQRRWNAVAEQLQTKYATEIYSKFMARVMKGKRVEFVGDTFFRLTEVFAPVYLKSMADKKAAFNQRFWNDEIYPDSLGGKIAEIMDHSLLQIDSETWKVKDFLKALRIHPLVFRKRKISHREFPEQFKLAIVDLIRDKYITQEAYHNGYDKAEVVKRNTVMWKDYLLAMFQKNRFLDELGVPDKDNLAVIPHYLDAYVDSLQSKYSHQIEIDTDAFEKIPLTRVDMFVLQKDVPFPILVPSFPLVTTDNKLDYGRKLGN